MGNGLWKRDGNEYLFVRDGKCARRVPQGPVDLGFGTTEGRFSAPRNRTLAAKQHAFEKCLALLDNKKGYPDGYPFFYLERETGIEPATPSLARRCSTTEPLAQTRHIIYEKI